MKIIEIQWRMTTNIICFKKNQCENYENLENYTNPSKNIVNQENLRNLLENNENYENLRNP